jgi:hypothetical protein
VVRDGIERDAIALDCQPDAASWEINVIVNALFMGDHLARSVRGIPCAPPN